MLKENYMFWMAMILMIVPFYFAGALIVIEDDATRKKWFIWGGLIGGISFSILLFLYMNVEITFGKSLLDAWYAADGDK